MSTTIPASAIGPKSFAASPGRSGTPRHVIFAWLRSVPTPETTTSSMPASSRTTQVPGPSSKLDADVHGHPVALGELDGADLQHLGAEARQLQHLVVGDARQLARRGHDVRVGGVDPVDVGENLAGVGLKRGGDRHRRRVGAAASQRGDVAVVVGALESRDHRDLALVERLEYARRP